MGKQHLAPRIFFILGGHDDQILTALSDEQLMKQKRLETFARRLTTFSKSLSACQSAIGGSELEELALRTAMSQAVTVDEWKECFFCSKWNSSEAFTCIRAIAALIENESVPA